MTKEEVVKAFEGVIANLQKELFNQTTLASYVYLEGKLDAYKDSLNLVSNLVIEAEKTTKDAEKKVAKA